MRTTVIIPTYRRPDMLLKCIASLLAGARKPDEIVIVGRKGDTTTENVIARIDSALDPSVGICSAWVTEPGHIPPVDAGVRIASGDLVAVVDDDVTVTYEWLTALSSHFVRADVGVVGGRVLVPGVTPPSPKGKPGCISWYGKIWGNLGSLVGPDSIEVDSVMEGNCMWLRSLLASVEFDPVLNFDDASMYGLDLGLQAKRLGFKVVYEPRALVFHHPAPRAPELDRQERGPRLYSYCRNYTYITLKWFSASRRFAFLAWWFLIGERDAWGLGSLVFDKLSGDWRKNRHVAQAWRGKIEGARLWLKR
jgi:GT2 family glycosyltransferase